MAGRRSDELAKEAEKLGREKEKVEKAIESEKLKALVSFFLRTPALCDAMRGTDAAFGGTRKWRRLVCNAICLRTRYAISGTNLAYCSTREDAERSASHRA